MSQHPYLEEMQIDQWIIHRPDNLIYGNDRNAISLPDDCCLLLVAKELPVGGDAEFFTKVVQSFGVTLTQTQFIEDSAMGNVELNEKTEWIWLAGMPECDILAMKQRWPNKKILSSLPLNQINGNNTERRALWQQIKSYE